MYSLLGLEVDLMGEKRVLKAFLTLKVLKPMHTMPLTGCNRF